MKPKTQSVGQPGMPKNTRDFTDNVKTSEPLSGSKKVKNENHSRHNNGEG
jgi:small acid-soluble spore protein P (minor)